MLTHRQVAQLQPLSIYNNTRRFPEWVVFHKFSITKSNTIRIISVISPDLWVRDILFLHIILVEGHNPTKTFSLVNFVGISCKRMQLLLHECSEKQQCEASKKHYTVLSYLFEMRRVQNKEKFKRQKQLEKTLFHLRSNYGTSYSLLQIVLIFCGSNTKVTSINTVTWKVVQVYPSIHWGSILDTHTPCGYLKP